jgi:hypothetical protein
MKRKVEAILLVLVIAALTAYLILQQTGKTHYSLPELPRLDKEEITRITVQKGDSELELKRDGERWRIVPEGYLADGKAVDRMLETLSGLRLTALASASETYAVYDLHEEECLHVIAFKGDDLLLSIGIGKPAPSYRHTFVKLADDRRVYHAEENFRSHFDKDVAALRDKQVLKIEEEISEIILAAGGERPLHMLRSTAPVGVDPNQEQDEAEKGSGVQAEPGWETMDGKPLKEQEIDGLVKTLSSLKCDGYLEETEKAELGEPTFSVSLKGSRNYEIALYDERDGKTVATSSENEYPFLLSDWKAKRIRKDLDDLVEKKE